MSARADPRGGRSAMVVPTATSMTRSEEEITVGVAEVLNYSLSMSGQDTTYLHAILLNSSSADA
jgi:hypothetical protein